MQRLILLTEKASKREQYFTKACMPDRIKPYIYSQIPDYIAESQPGDWVKIDPPSIRDYGVEDLPVFIQSYQRNLHKLAALPGISFLNSPKAILTALDKRRTKEILFAHQIQTPPILPDSLTSYADLTAYMERHSLLRVFIKPRYGSGAAGVCAFLWNPRRLEGILYTPLAFQNGSFINTKKIHKTKDPAYNRLLIDFVFSLSALVEVWITKPRIGSVFYDLRVVWQFGRIEAVIPRGSHSPITNLHLNDMALPLSQVQEQLNWPQIKDVCHRAVSSIEGLQCAGLDLVCTQNNCQMIEINSQGDLIYQDIYEDNQIYRSQVKQYQNQTVRLQL